MKKYTLKITFDLSHVIRISDNDCESLHRIARKIKGSWFDFSTFCEFEMDPDPGIFIVNRKSIRTIEVIENEFCDE